MAEQNCIFCQIITGQKQATIIWQDDSAIAIQDIFPQAPSHLLIIPKEHYSDITECKDNLLLGKMLNRASFLAAQEGLSSGFRIVINNGKQAGQTVSHLHIHVLGGREMKWPPG